MSCDTPPHHPDLDQLELFVVCLPGLEPMLAEELRGLGAKAITPTAGGVSCRGGLAMVYGINQGSGLGSHVLVRIAEFGARSLADLDHRGSRVRWDAWLPPGQSVEVRARCRRSRIYHTGAAAERIEKHLLEQLGAPTADADPVTVRVRIEDNRCTLSLDASGAPLHRRGWRQNPGRAPLREDLAHALILASGWDRRSPLVDPMMGSGTILIEAAGLARGLAPGRLRTFAVERAAFHDPATQAAVRAEAARRECEPAARIYGGDRDAGAVAIVEANAAAAGVERDLSLRTGGLSESFVAWGDLGSRGSVVTNPPYGKRLDDADALGSLYRSLGQCVEKLPAATWGFAMMVADRRLGARTSLTLQSRFLVDSGGLKVSGLCRPPAS